MKIYLCDGIYSLKNNPKLSQYGWTEVVGPAVPERAGPSPKGRTPTYAIFSQVQVLSRFMPFLKSFHRAFNESYYAL